MEANIKDVADLIRGVTYEKSLVQNEAKVGLIPIARATNINAGVLDQEDLVYVPESFVSISQMLKEGDILIATSSGSKSVVGKAARIESFHTEMSFGAFCSVIRPQRHEFGKWVRYNFNTPIYRTYVESVAIGTNINKFQTSDLEKYSIPVPPLSEQRRIVTKLDALTARLGRARAELGRIDKLTVRLRDKIYGYFDSKDANGELQSLLEIPIRNGLSIKGSDTPPGVPALRLSALRTGLVDLTDVRYLPIDQNRAALYSLQDGDILVSRGNGTLSYVGRAALVVQPSTKNAAVIFPDTAFRIRVDKTKADPNWIVQIWNSPIVRSQIEGKARTTAGIWKISQKYLLEIRIPKLPLAEQQFASRRLAAGFARADRFEAEATRAKKLLDRLESAILAKAFRGELVPQDPTDEPASILLDRIRAQRLAAPASKRGRSVKAASA